MKKCKKIKNMFDESFSHELDEDQKKDLANHLGQCKQCNKEYQNMTILLSLLKEKRPKEPRPDFFDNYWANLQNRLAKEGHFKERPGFSLKNLFLNLQSEYKWVLRSAATLVLIVMGIFIGRIFLPSSGGPSYNSISSTTPALSAHLIQNTQDYIDQSKVLLLALINFDPATDEFYALNLSRQQQISKELVHRTAFIKDGLKDLRQQRLLELIEDLEIILMQIANLGSDPDIADVKMISEGATRRGILFKIQLSNLRKTKNIKEKNQTI